MTETEFAVLDGLATYRFLTAKQLHRLGVTKNERHIYDVLHELEKRGLIERIKFGFKGAGMAYVWRLVLPGSRAHAEEARCDPVVVPRRLSKNDREHCLGVVDFHIS